MQQALPWVLSYMEDLACPRAVTVAILARHGEWEQILNLDCSPMLYQCAEDYLAATAATDFLRKCTDVPYKADLAKTTFDKWLWAEQQCVRTNRRLSDLCAVRGIAPANAHRLIEYFARVSEIITGIIGEKPPLNFKGRFGPGATMSDKSHRASIPHKMASSPSLTSDAIGYLLDWSTSAWARACTHRAESLTWVRGNAYFTVPKTALTLRACAKEPSLNGFYQLGIGRVLRQRLKDRVGIDLELGQDTHRQVAREASLTGEFSTIDLSSASDCLSTALVELCLPPCWLEALMDLRSPLTRVGKRWYHLAKFSSMGNGFTFELETLIFLALILALAPKELIPGFNVWVYGDDIIVPTGHAQDVIAALRYCGFTPNVKKTFLDGPFRESCGGDYYNGESVRAHFITEGLPNEPQEYISLANGIKRVCDQLAQIRRVPASMRSWFRVLDNIPSSIRMCRGPDTLGDLVIHDHERFWQTRTRHSIRYIRVYRPAKWKRLTLDRFDPTIKLATALYLIGSGRSSLTMRSVTGTLKDGFVQTKRSRETALVPRDGVLGYKVGWVPYS